MNGFNGNGYNGNGVGPNPAYMNSPYGQYYPPNGGYGNCNPQYNNCSRKRKTRVDWGWTLGMTGLGVVTGALFGIPIFGIGLKRS